MIRKTPVLLAGLLLVAGGYVAADAADLVPGVLTIAPTPPPLASPLPTPAPSTSEPPSVPPTTAGLTKALAGPLADPALGRSVAYSIRDGRTGQELLAKGTAAPRRVASLQKIITALALTKTLDLESTMATRVVATTSPDEIVLVAGGDMLLSPTGGTPDAVAGRAGLADLATQVAGGLQGRSAPVRVRLDTSYAAGPAIPSAWLPADVELGYAGRVSMLALATQRAYPGRPGPSDPALEAARTFVERLRERGVDAQLAPTATPAATPNPGKPAATPSPSATPRAAAAAPATPPAATKQVLGQVDSAPLREVLELGLQDSENAILENLARQAMSAQGQDAASSTGAWVATQAAAAGIDRSALHITDASGLAPNQSVTVAAVSHVLSLAVDGRHEELRRVIQELPVAGLTGTLTDRFDTAKTRQWAGVPRAKTGTLTGISSIGGWTTDSDGYPLLYVIVADAVRPSFLDGTEPARAALDRAVGALTSCGCR